jgi:hypothetical protein
MNCCIYIFLQNDTLLHKAALGGNEAICSLLIKNHNADVKAKNLQVRDVRRNLKSKLLTLILCHITSPLLGRDTAFLRSQRW